MKTKKGVIHQYAFCEQCGGKNEEYINGAARKWAYNHAKETGHRVTVETGSFITYNP